MCKAQVGGLEAEIKMFSYGSVSFQGSLSNPSVDDILDGDLCQISSVSLFWSEIEYLIQFCYILVFHL